MKSDHRHELKTNELAEWIANFPQWARDNGTIIISISVVAVLVIGSALWYWRKTKVESVQEQLEFTNLIAKLPQNKIQVLMRQSRGEDISYMLIQTAVDLETVANGAQDENMAALALIKRAESLRAAVHYRQETVNQADLLTAVDAAKIAYNKAISKAVNNPSLMAMAKFGLGICEEETGNFDEAERIYRDLIKNSDFEGTTTVAKAQRRLETMADYRKKIVFKPAPIPKPPVTDMTDLLPPIPLRPIEVDVGQPNDFPVVPEVMIGPEPNPGIVVPDVKIQPEPNAVSESLNIKPRPQEPNNVLGGVDTNVPGE
ncbi:MAG: tetratricopeptide repeat protein [Phycisphaerae bacterium]|nr:tetratricopeptide repeat protein [Phycisphaerae bacterium]